MQGQRRAIVSVDDEAARLGLTPGMSVAHAQSLLPDLIVMDATPEEDEAALFRLAIWCVRYSPVVAVNPPDGVFIDVAGSAHLFHGENALLTDLGARLESAGYRSKAAISDTPGCSWALARYGSTSLASPGRQAEAIASLPVAALRLPAEVVSSLHEVGIERIAQLASKPRASLHLRFGADVLLRFDQALGSLTEALTSIIPPELPRVELKFVEPIADPDNLQRVIERLCEKLCLLLEGRGVGARRLDLVFTRVDNVDQSVRIGLSRPYREPKHLAKLLAERLVLVDPGLGIEIAALTASWVEALAEKQTIGRHVGMRGADVDVSQLVDTLGVRLGQNKVFRLTPVESALPERSMKRIPALDPIQSVAWPKNLPRPARLFDRPEKVHAIAALPDHPPRMFVWRNRQHRVAKADGPERIHGEWWISDAELSLVRDYYRIETADGSRYWIFRNGPAGEGGGWWLHGVGEA
ncbi:DNA polymerase Y family protein [Bradyrhizobium acaciae]|uniref:DNA polymerase Y family protein n=1 Tax=Bradyrhizobium acaciae TaxID=2683706 RepID=UPI001E65B948